MSDRGETPPALGLDYNLHQHQHIGGDDDELNKGGGPKIGWRILFGNFQAILGVFWKVVFLFGHC